MNFLEDKNIKLKRGKETMITNPKAIKPMKKAFLLDQRYHDILKKFKKASSQLKQLKELKIDHNEYQRIDNDLSNKLRQEVQDFVKVRRAEITEEMAKLEREAKTLSELKQFTDPTQEVLRRQNLEAKLMIMSNTEFSEYLKNSNHSTDYELSLLKKEADKRGYSSQFEAYKGRAQSEHERSPKYQELAEAGGMLSLIDKADTLQLFDYDENTNSAKQYNQDDLGDL